MGRLQGKSDVLPEDNIICIFPPQLEPVCKPSGGTTPIEQVLRLLNRVMKSLASQTVVIIGVTKSV